MPTDVRPRTDADLEPSAAVLRAVRASDGYPVRWPADPAAWLAPSGTLAAWVAETDDAGAGRRVVGHALLRHADGTSAADLLAAAAGVGVERVALVSRLFVDPSARRCGAGRALLEAVRAEASARGLVLGLDVVDKDRAAIAMYERAGWRRVGTLACDWLPGPDQPPLHCYLAP